MAAPEIPTIERVKNPFARGESSRIETTGLDSTPLPSATHQVASPTNDEEASTGVGSVTLPATVEPPRQQVRTKLLGLHPARHLQGLRPMTGYEEQLIEERMKVGNAAALCNALLTRCLATPGDETNAATETVGSLLVAERDVALVELRQMTFGNRVDTEVNCPTCAQLIAMSFDLNQLQVNLGDVPEAMETVLSDGRATLMRIPTATDQADLLALDLPSDAERRTWLLARCLQVLGASTGPFTAAWVHRLDSGTRCELEAELNRHVPSLDLSASAQCIECGHVFSSPFDLPSFFLPNLAPRRSDFS